MTFAPARPVLMVPLQNILVVEHEPEQRARLASILEREYEVASAASSRDAIGALEQGRFDLVLLGQLGESADTQALLDGLCACAHRPKVILLAPEFTEDVLDRASLLSADGVLRCPDEQEVSASVAAHLGS